MSVRHYAIRAFWERYAFAVREAWGRRFHLDPVRRLRHESEFMPAALALRDTPMHPAPRVATHVIMAMFAIATGWAIFGKVDVVASAPGKVVPNAEIKLIQPQETAVVTAIHVADGAYVRRGDALIDLDATDAATTAEHARTDLLAASAESLRAQAMLSAVDGKHPPELSSISSLGAAEVIEQRRVLNSEYSDYLSNLHALESEIDQAEAVLRQSDAEISKLSQVFPIEQTKELDYAKLIKSGYVGLHDYYNEQQAVIQLRQNLAEEKAKHVQSRAALDAATRKRDAYVAQTRRQWLEKLSDDQTKAAGLQQDLNRAEQHRKLMHLTAPVDGTVQQLAVHTIGGVVTPAQNLMSVVPSNDWLVVEANVSNQDIGFVREKQPVEVKVEAFPFTRYGTLQGKVLMLSNDAKQDENKQWFFPARIILDRSSMSIDGRPINLVPGMTVTAEIKTDRRRVISYLLSPLIQHAKESMRER